MFSAFFFFYLVWPSYSLCSKKAASVCLVQVSDKCVACAISSLQNPILLSGGTSNFLLPFFFFSLLCVIQRFLAFWCKDSPLSLLSKSPGCCTTRGSWGQLKKRQMSCSCEFCCCCSEPSRWLWNLKGLHSLHFTFPGIVTKAGMLQIQGRDCWVMFLRLSLQWKGLSTSSWSLDSAGIVFLAGGNVDELAKLMAPMSEVLICRL